MTETNNEILQALDGITDIDTSLKTKFNLDFNPFPKSGIADIDAPDIVKRRLEPASIEVTKEIVTFIKDSMSNRQSDNRYQSLVIKGEYGTGKTQTLMFIQYLLKHLNGFKPFVVYLDDPGKSLSELIGTVIGEIGIENFRRYLWNIYMSFVDEDSQTKSKLLSYVNLSRLFTNYGDISKSTVFVDTFKSYKELKDALLLDKNSKMARNEIEEYLLGTISSCFINKFESTNVARYYVGILSENINLSKSWELIVSGGANDLVKKEVILLKSIVEIVKTQMDYTDFYMLVDEFEEVTSNRLSRKEADNYLSNLRTLIDREKNWCSVFAMNSRAFEDIKQVSLALAGRISDRVITLTPLNNDGLKNIIYNYISTARKNNDSIYPFDDTAVQALFDEITNPNLKGSPRYLLKTCYKLLQRAAEDLPNGGKINADYVMSYLNESEE